MCAHGQNRQKSTTHLRKQCHKVRPSPLDTGQWHRQHPVYNSLDLWNDVEDVSAIVLQEDFAQDGQLVLESGFL